MSFYPNLIRNQMHEHHDYTLQLADSIEVRLTQQQIVSLWKQIEHDQTPLSTEDIAALKTQLEEIRADRANR